MKSPIRPPGPKRHQMPLPLPEFLKKGAAPDAQSAAAPLPARRRAAEPLSTGSEWNFDLVARYDREIARVAEKFGLDTYPNQVEVISAEQMMDAYASNGMPIGYYHWSFGKRFLATEQVYKRGAMGLAYEIVINSNPCIAYLLEENTMPMQALVVAHACYGHNSFFKGNYLFRTWTQPDAIVDYLLFSKQYIIECEQRYGEEEVERTLDACHALATFGVDRYKRPPKRTLAQERLRLKDREEHLQQQVNDLWRTLPLRDAGDREHQEARFPSEPQENLLYFLEKHAPLLEPWQREIARIVRKLAQYFYPQRQTQVMNEGWATFWHYTIMHELYEEGLLADSFMLEILHSHTNVLTQPGFDSRHYSGINPYALGFAMYRDLRRICESPTDEDRQWFPDIAGTDWIRSLDFAMRNFKDESFIQQFLSPKVIRDFRLFALVDDDEQPNLRVGAIHNDEGYRAVRESLARQYALSEREPNIQIVSVDAGGDRSLTLRHFRTDRRPLAPMYKDVIRHLAYLWGFAVKLETASEDGSIELTHECKLERRRRGEPALAAALRSVG